MTKQFLSKWLSASSLAALALLVAVPGAAAQELFRQLLGEAGLHFVEPPGFTPRPHDLGARIPYEHALRSLDGHMEIRYAIRPLARVEIDYDDPHSSAPEADHLFPLMFDSTTQYLSTHAHTPRREYAPEQALELFNADWAAASAFDVHPEFSDEFSDGLLLALHKSGRADAYVIFLYNPQPEIRQSLKQHLTTLAFTP